MDSNNKKYKRRTREDFINELNEKFPDEYEVLSEFYGMSKKVTLHHKPCRHIWEVKPSNLINNGSSCPNCKSIKLSNLYRGDLATVKSKIESEGFSLLSNEYKNAKTKLTIECQVGHTFQMNYNNFQQGQRCPKCAIIHNAERQRLSMKDIENQVIERGFALIRWENGYVNTQSKFTLKCKNNHTTTKSVSSFIQGCDCPKCVKPSKGEVDINNFLNENHCLYEYQYHIEECKNKRPLPFDFAIFNDDKSIRFLIEYDGEQHFRPIERFGGMEKFKKNKFNDNIKDKFCEENNIKLIRIPYTELNNINKILKEVLH